MLQLQLRSTLRVDFPPLSLAYVTYQVYHLSLVILILKVLRYCQSPSCEVLDIHRNIKVPRLNHRLCKSYRELFYFALGNLIWTYTYRRYRLHQSIHISRFINKLLGEVSLNITPGILYSCYSQITRLIAAIQCYRNRLRPHTYP